MVYSDLEFPEWTRMAAIADANILALPTNWPLIERLAGERAPEVRMATAAARVNRMAIACADRAGAGGGVQWTEGPTVINADGWVVDAVGSSDTIAWATIDASTSRDKRLPEFSAALADRRLELYLSAAASVRVGTSGA